MDVTYVIAGAGVLLVLLGALLLWWLRRPKAVTHTSIGITDSMWWLWEQMLLLEPSSRLGGIAADKPGYHNCRANLPSYDYSVCDRPPDDGGPSNMAAAIDWTFPDAQAGNYSTISKYTKRLLASAQDPNDPRLNGWREFYGQSDSDSHVEGWDCRYGVAATSDSSHLWHIHLSENRDQTTSMANKQALVSVLKGETVDEWLGEDARREGDGAVLLNCPYDEDRLDLFYVGPNGTVMHRWYPSGGMNAMWVGPGKVESLGGRIVAGTLTAAWSPDGSRVNIAGVGDPDEPGCPPDCGNYWGFVLERGGLQSGWGSVPGAWGKVS